MKALARQPIIRFHTIRGYNRQMTPYRELNHVLDDLVSGIQELLRADFIGAYLQGSFAVGDFDEHSDVDYAIVTEAELTDDQVGRLQEMHGRIFDLPSRWAQHLEGSYFPRSVLRAPLQPGTQLWFLDNGSRALVQSDHCNTNVVRWVLYEKGIALAGPPLQTLLDPVPTAVLRQEIRETIINWGHEILDNPQRFNNRFYQGFIVLSFCRMLHSIDQGIVCSKSAGAEWAKENLDPSWSGLIDRTWDTRPNPAQSVRQPADPVDFEQTLRFVREAIDLVTTAGGRWNDSKLSDLLARSIVFAQFENYNEV